MKTIKQLMLSIGIIGTYFAAQGGNHCEICDKYHEGPCRDLPYLDFLGKKITGLEHLPEGIDDIEKIVRLLETAPVDAINLHEICFVLGMKVFTNEISCTHSQECLQPLQDFLEFLSDIQDEIYCINDVLWIYRKINEDTGIRVKDHKKFHKWLNFVAQLDCTNLPDSIDESDFEIDPSGPVAKKNKQFELDEETQVDFFEKIKKCSTIEQECILCTVREVCLGLGIDTNYDLSYKRQDNSLNTNILRLIAAHVNGSTDFLRVDAALQAYANRLHEHK